MGSAAGARKVAAARIGVPLAEYDARVMRGEKWCMACKRWHLRKAFGRDASRGDGLAARCLGSNSSKSAALPWLWITKGFTAFPDEWARIAVVAYETSENPWVDEWLEACV